MSTIWIFGDSFAHDITWGADERVAEQQWHRLIAKKLGMSVQNFGLGGVSIEYCSYTWYDNRSKIKADDLVIVIITEINRRWLVEENPTLSTAWLLEAGIYDERASSIQRKAMGFYFRYLHHDRAEKANLENWIFNVQSVAEKGTRTLIISAFDPLESLIDDFGNKFPNLEKANGVLGTNSHNEIVDELKPLLIQDGRYNHFTIPNHHVLSDKIILWVNEGITVDLNTGFFKDVIKDPFVDYPDLLNPLKFKKTSF